MSRNLVVELSFKELERKRKAELKSLENKKSVCNGPLLPEGPVTAVLPCFSLSTSFNDIQRPLFIDP